jgi:hypothetical protein
LQQRQIGAGAATGIQNALRRYFNQFQPIEHARRYFTAQEIGGGDAFRAGKQLADALQIDRRAEFGGLAGTCMVMSRCNAIMSAVYMVARHRDDDRAGFQRGGVA